MIEISQKTDLTCGEALDEYEKLLGIDENKSNVGFYNKIRDRMNYLKDVIVKQVLKERKGIEQAH